MTPIQWQFKIKNSAYVLKAIQIEYIIGFFRTRKFPKEFPEIKIVVDEMSLNFDQKINYHGILETFFEVVGNYVWKKYDKNERHFYVG